jgi:catechol 2,3-dioxygenase-like lactoylglutathione lyase family enzyme
MISGFDHLAITCLDIDASIAFYERVLGARLLHVDHWRAGAMPVALMNIGAQNLSLHRASSPARPHATSPTPGAVDLCLRWEGSIDEAVAHLGAQDIEVIEGPVPRHSSDGRPASSVYFRDLDGNLLEFLAVDR